MKYARTLQDHLGTGRRLIADHLLRARSAPNWTDPFPVNAGGHDNAFARTKELSGPIDGGEGACFAARIGIRGLRIRPVHIVSPGELEACLPGFEFRAIRKKYRRVKALEGLSDTTQGQE